MGEGNLERNLEKAFLVINLTAVNRTMMELKYLCGRIAFDLPDTVNRTMMELKSYITR
ncbi:MAG TPA: hypothetical protein VD884_03995 [Ohtaekwangia sp.]|nr:hypothetical protein [Ohtaekwangia sp.]